jgi:hypothetical protein
MPSSGDHAGGCEGPPIHSEFIRNEKPSKQPTASILTNCPNCGYALHFCCESGSFYTRSCPVCKCTIKLGIEIIEPSPLTPEQLKEKQNQYRG